jgi:hypothetical protein
VINLIIEQEAISANDKIFGINKSGAKYLYKAYRDKLKTTLICSLGIGQEQERTAWKIVRHWGANKRQFDDANLVGGFKPLFDALVKINHIQDDNPDYFKAYYFQRKSNTGEGYIELIQLDNRGELKVGLEKLAETYEVDQSTLLELAKETNLIKRE